MGGRRRWTGVALCVAVLTACSSTAEDAAEVTTTAVATTTTTTAPAPDVPIPSTTVSTIYAPDTVEGQVEAAYLRSWDVYARAVYTLELDEEALAEVYMEPQLGAVRQDIVRRVPHGRAARVHVEHDYSIEVIRPGYAVIVDEQVNHQVLIDPNSKEPVEADPNERILRAIVVELVGERWLVARVDRVAEP